MTDWRHDGCRMRGHTSHVQLLLRCLSAAPAVGVKMDGAAFLHLPWLQLCFGPTEASGSEGERGRAGQEAHDLRAMGRECSRVWRRDS